MYLLSMRDHSRVELERKLCDHADGEIAADTAQRMEDLGLINDEEYAARLARDLRLRKHFSKRRAMQEMAERGIDREVAQQAAENVDTEDVQQALRTVAQKTV